MTFNKKGRVIIHAGEHKTGSTSLQAWLAKNDEKLKKQGYSYSNHFRHGAGNHQFGWNLYQYMKTDYPYALPRFKRSNIEQMIQQLELNSDSNGDVTIISTESLSVLDELAISWLAKKLKDYDVKIAIYVRPAIEWIESGYKHHVLQKNTAKKIEESYQKDFLYLLNHVLYGRYERLNNWKKWFGEDNVIVIPYVKESLKERNIINDFNHNLLDGKIDLSRMSGIENKNISPSSSVVEAIRRLNGEGYFRYRTKKYKRRIAHIIAKDESMNIPRSISFYDEAFASEVHKKFIRTKRAL